MLLECVNHLKRQNKEYRSLHLFGQEKNVITSTIARMNMLLHGFEDAKIKRGDTLDEPLFLKKDKLEKFDVILANPPYSINRWNRKSFARDPYGRNIYGTPPQGRADYAFIQHIICSLSKIGRAAILLPHGVLFRDGEEHIRKKLVEYDKLEAVIGLPKDMFYNSVMESCIMIFKDKKDITRKNKIQFINAVKEFERKNNKNFLTQLHIEKIVKAFIVFTDIENFSYVAKNTEVVSNNYSLSIPLYLKQKTRQEIPISKLAIKQWSESSQFLRNSLSKLVEGN